MERPPLSGPRLALLTVALPLATFMQVVDATIANVAVPTIAGNLGASASQGTWVITSYAVANAIVLPLTGSLARRFGEVRLFLWSSALFTLSSFLCGLAGDLRLLVLFRILQGALGGPMMPLAQSLLLNNYPPERRVMAIALWSMTVSVAPVFGPILGGLISDNCHWGWIFLINVPVGLLVLFMTGRLLAGRESETGPTPSNLLSFAFLAVGVGSFQLMLDRGKELDWFASGEIVGLAVLAGLGLAFLAVWDWHNPTPLLDLRLFSSRNFSVGVVCISLGMMIYLGTVVLLPLLLQTRFGYTATWAGLASAPIGLLPIFLTPLIGRNAHKVDLRLVISFGFLVFAFCMFWRTNFAPGLDLAFVVWPQVIQGAAMACFFVPITTLTFIGLAPSRLAGAAGLFNCIRTLFGGIGASVVTTLWERREIFHHVRLSGRLDPYNPLAVEALRRLEELGMSAEQSAAYLAGQITRQGFIMGAAEIYQLCAWGFLSLIAVIWLARSTSGRGPGL
ncbi:MAG: DHA2 family efflux MFS transporter permease subunit [Candidatus Adiutrix sp.]|nr:DHA2 family efflux MFS transporter permease subunit [Candidatus Adiutrix sp.]